jgi:tRNA-splicing ligase RtcB
MVVFGSSFEWWLDEIPGAYKDIESVIRAQADLVEVVARLRQLVCVKG